MKYQYKKAFVDAYFIDLDDKASWPDGVIVNAASRTGISYKSLDEKPVTDQAAGSVYVEGFEIINRSWLVIFHNKIAINLEVDEFEERFQL